MTAPTLALSPDCERCGGSQEIWWDEATIDGEHSTKTAPCPDCQGGDAPDEDGPLDVDDDRDWGVECAWSPYERSEP